MREVKRRCEFAFLRDTRNASALRPVSCLAIRLCSSDYAVGADSSMSMEFPGKP